MQRLCLDAMLKMCLGFVGEGGSKNFKPSHQDGEERGGVGWGGVGSFLLAVTNDVCTHHVSHDLDRCS